MHVERLTILRDRLLKIARTPVSKRTRAFNMDVWFSRHEDDGNKYCGTAACALGEAAMLRRFQREGLNFDFSGHPTYRAIVTFGDAVGYRAAADFFEIGVDQAENIFCPMKYAKPRLVKPGEVAARVTALLKEAA